MIRANFYVAATLWKRFRKGCIDHNMSASRALTELMQQQLSAWCQEEAPPESESASLRLRTPPTSQLRDVPNITFEVQGRPLPEPHKETTP
jgi:hypothetical protein